MKIVFNCCPKPALFKHNGGMTLFKGEQPEVKVETKLQPLPQDKVEVNSKGAENKPECVDCK